jgi:uncharacterized protein
VKPYHAPTWLPGGNLQTIYASWLTPAPPAYRRERWTTPDNDFIDLDWLDGNPAAPLVVLFHGLEGSSRGHYGASLMRALQRAGLRGVVPHFRGCSGEPNRLARAYHSGDAAEIDWILRRLRKLNPDASIHAVGVSLGGNALLKWLGEQGSDAGQIICSAVAVSAPIDLNAAGDTLERGFNLIYTRHFMRSLKPKAEQKLAHHPGLLDRRRLRSAITLRHFDDVYTAPVHGYADARDYWTRASSKPVLRHIRIPTLLLNARNDPFLPAAALPTPGEVSPAVTLEYPEQGGHVGFVSGPFPGNLFWLPQRILAFFDSHPATPIAR